jgi:hypothetical protein
MPSLSKFLERFPLYPFLAALYPVLYLVSVNISETTPMAGLRSALLFLALALLAFLFFLACTRNVQRSALYTLATVLVFFLIFFVLYAPVYAALREVKLAGHVLGRHRYLVPASALLVGVSAVLLLVFGRRIPQKWLNGISAFANVAALVLTLLPVITIASAMIKEKNAVAQSSADLPSVTPLGAVEQKPDIYYIILDMNTNENAMMQLMAYDDSAFTQALEERGFFVTTCSRSNYDSTKQSLTSSLNMDYLQDLNVSGGMDGLYPLVQQSRVRRLLESAGYETWAFKTGYSYLDLKDADHYSDPTSGALNLLTYPGITNFESLILSISAGQVLYENRDGLSKTMQTFIDAPYMQRREEIFNIMGSLPQVAAADSDTPKFVYAHILAPHDPFVFDETGAPAFRRFPFTQNKDPEFGAGYGWDAYKKAYVDEVIYLHGAVIEMIDDILANSATPPVIILQGDHGIPYSKPYDAQFEILNAYYFPGVSETGLYDTISPVNSFRLVFNDYFGAEYPLLPDESYLTGDNFTFSPFSEPFTCPDR